MLSEETKRIIVQRRGGQVVRFHIEPSFRKQTDAEHTFNALLLLFELEPVPNLNVVRALLYHDLGEQATGDVPAFVRWQLPETSEALDKIERAFLEQITNWFPDLYGQESELVLICDRLELCFTMLEELMRGSIDAIQMYYRVKDSRIGESMARHAVAEKIYANIMEMCAAVLQGQSRVLLEISELNPRKYPTAVAIPRVPKKVSS